MRLGLNVMSCWQSSAVDIAIIAVRTNSLILMLPSVRFTLFTLLATINILLQLTAMDVAIRPLAWRQLKCAVSCYASLPGRLTAQLRRKTSTARFNALLLLLLHVGVIAKSVLVAVANGQQVPRTKIVTAGKLTPFINSTHQRCILFAIGSYNTFCIEITFKQFYLLLKFQLPSLIN